MDNMQQQSMGADANGDNPSLFYHNGKGWAIDPEADKAIQTFFNRFYTINLGTRLLIGKGAISLSLSWQRCVISSTRIGSSRFSNSPKTRLLAFSEYIINRRTSGPS